MAILQGISGGLSGKMGNVVFRQRYGETVASQYQPHVTNPNTVAQADNRAAFKLITQLGAEFAPAIAIARRGAVTGRNIFTQRNLPLVEVTETAEGAQATIDLSTLQLTDSNAAFNGIMDVNLSPTESQVVFTDVEGYDRIVIVVASTVTGSLAVTERPARIRSIQTVNVVAGSPTLVTVDISTEPDETYTVLAYGISFTNSRARESFDNVVAGSGIAGVNVARTISFADSALSMTVGQNVTVQ